MASFARVHRLVFTSLFGLSSCFCISGWHLSPWGCDLGPLFEEWIYSFYPWIWKQVPHFCWFELFWEIFVNLLAHWFYWASVSIVGKDNRVFEVRRFIGSFSVHSDKIQFLPYFFKKSIKIQLHIATDNDCIRLHGYHVDFLHWDCVNFVVAIQTFNVLSVPLDNIDQIINCTVIVN